MIPPLVELGGSGPVVHLAPANGFPLSTYRPIVDRLVRSFRVVAIPPRGLWPGAGPAPREFGSWESIAEDLVNGLERHGIERATLVGHSFGGVAAIVAAARHPARVAALAVLDPTLLPAAVVEQFTLGRDTGWTRAQHPLAVAARTRRTEFASGEEAYRIWRQRALFAEWSDEALHRYVDGALAPAPNGGLTLAWPADWEAYYYESVYLGGWNDVARLDPTLPILAIAGGASTAFEPPEHARFQAALPWARLEVVPGHGHLFPQTAPDLTARILGQWAEGLDRW